MSVADDSGGRGRWAGAFLIAAVLHAVPVMIAVYWLGPTIMTPPATPEPAVLIDMAPPATPPAPPTDRSPGPQRVKAKAPHPRVAKARIKVPPAPHAAAVVPVKPPEPVTPRPEAVAPAPQTTAPPPRPAPPAPAPSGAAVTWQGQLLGRLNQSKRYPVSARIRHQQGVPYVRFVMDRGGRVLSSRLERSSGYDVLDREAVDLPMRAQPLPKPPADVPGETIELVMPVEFFLRR